MGKMNPSQRIIMGVIGTPLKLHDFSTYDSSFLSRTSLGTQLGSLIEHNIVPAELGSPLLCSPF